MEAVPPRDFTLTDVPTIGINLAHAIFKSSINVRVTKPMFGSYLIKIPVEAGSTILNRACRELSNWDEREVLPSSSEATSAVTEAAAATHGIEVAMGFKPVEHPTKPLDNDQPIQCPLPEPSILNDGRMGKERVSSGVQRRTDMQVISKPTTPVESITPGTKPRPTNRVTLPSVSAPEHSILKLLEESGFCAPSQPVT
ncbi:uncharacterized protein LOC111398421 [Olea europaea var. sylvestris]|uniref:uncharacterized protein LOC111398421 n=1 Tax=Olea europaea var. sylvestris TaxID=158386 RepID=UPI000C1D8C3B|nr:uncharacterized protein LOC111398421 [Olea europaea var. sylvestris]